MNGQKNNRLPMSAAYLGFVSDPQADFKKHHNSKARPNIFQRFLNPISIPESSISFAIHER
jgi:hypothetical protein